MRGGCDGALLDFYRCVRVVDGFEVGFGVSEAKSKNDLKNGYNIMMME